jgi:multiple sugar transport system substrate-binding protein
VRTQSLRRLGAAATVLVAATALAACGSSDGGGGDAAGGDGTVKISFLTHWSPDTVKALKADVAEYRKTHPKVEIDVKAVPFSDLLTTLRSQAGSSSGPTVSSIYDLWLPELVRDGVLAKAPAANAGQVTSGWPENLAADATVQGSVYGYPNEVDLYALNYNKKLFREAGIASPPKTWDELRADAQKLTKRDGDRIKQQGFGLISSWAAGTVHPFTSLLNSNGGSLIENGKPTLNTPQAAQAFQLIEDLVKKDKVTDASMGTADANTTGPYLDNFVSGKTAMIIMANWWESALKAGLKDKFADIGTAPIPAGPSGDGTSHSVSYSWMTVVNGKAGDAKQKAAWDFLSWLNGKESGTKAGASAMSDLLQSMGILPSSTADLEAWKSELDRPFLKAYVDQLADAKPFPVVLGGQEFTEGLQKTIEAVQAGQMSAKDAQSRAQDDATATLEAAAQ